jgi:hypothetical protein
MIRIDEIYYNVFAAALQDQMASAHWFDPFGSCNFDDLCNVPAIDEPCKRFLFWDQEPLHLDICAPVIERFVKTFKDDVTLVTSEFNSDNVKTIADTYNIKTAYYFFHGWAALDWYRGYHRSFLYKSFKDRKISKTFINLNNIIGGRRRHRLELFSHLVQQNLIQNNHVSFPDVCPFEGKTVQELCDYYSISLGSVDLPLKVDDSDNYQHNSHRIDIWHLANDSLLQVVTETVYNGQRLHLTEKTFKPIVMQQPFILVSCRGSLEYLRKYGFRTFGDFWDEGYDDCDDSERINKISGLLNELNNLSLREKAQLQQHLAPVVEHNHRWFYSGGFENVLWQELTEMINQW